MLPITKAMYSLIGYTKLRRAASFQYIHERHSQKNRVYGSFLIIIKLLGERVQSIQSSASIEPVSLTKLRGIASSDNICNALNVARAWL